MSDLKLVPNLNLPKNADVLKKKRVSPAQLRQAMTRTFRPFAVELGWILYEWNGLHEGLCQVFADLATNRDMAYSIWHSTPNDRSQRDMLRAALKSNKSDDIFTLRLTDGVSCVLKKLEDLTHRRNDAIHAPLLFVSLAGDGLRLVIEPNTFSGNPRARNLPDDQELMTEFKWYRDHLERLSRYVGELHWAWQFSDTDQPYPWPDKPLLPSRGQYQSRETKHRKNGSK